MIIGEINELKMIRKSDLGFMLSDGTEDVLLHYKEATKELSVDEYVRVFIYLDKEGRNCATMQEPYITLSKYGFVEVVSVESFGVYIQNNCAKDFLISKDNLPYNKNAWPCPGDKILAFLKIKKNRMLAKPLNREEINLIPFERKFELGESVLGYVCKISEGGIGVVSEDMQHIFVPTKLTRGDYRIGQAVITRITGVHEYDYYGSLIDTKEKMLDSDSVLIVEYLKAHKNKMPLTAKSSADEVFAEFKMSRKAFKRALGILYKQQVIDCLENETILLDKE